MGKMEERWEGGKQGRGNVRREVEKRMGKGEKGKRKKLGIRKRGKRRR